jgi:hypothetical protein
MLLELELGGSGKYNGRELVIAVARVGNGLNREVIESERGSRRVGRRERHAVKAGGYEVSERVGVPMRRVGGGLERGVGNNGNGLLKRMVSPGQLLLSRDIGRVEDNGRGEPLDGLLYLARDRCRPTGYEELLRRAIL